MKHNILPIIFFVIFIFVSISMTAHVTNNIENQNQQIEKEIMAIQKQITQIKEDQKNRESDKLNRISELNQFERWLKEPSLKEFENIVRIGQTLGISRDELFARYMNKFVIDGFSTYISKDGVRTYKASTVRERIISTSDDVSRVDTYYGKHSPELRLPLNLYAIQDKLDGFLTIMEAQFPRKN